MEPISFFFPLEIINIHGGFLHLNLLSHKIIQMYVQQLRYCFVLIANVIQCFAWTEPSGPWCLSFALAQPENLSFFHTS